jgi:carboxylesterase type B
MKKYDHMFSPSGYPIRDKCKVCGGWCITTDGLKDLGLDILRSGSMSNKAREMLLADRAEAIAHGVIQEHQFPIAALDKAISQRKKQEHQSFTDIDVDNDAFKPDQKKGSVEQTEEQEKIEDLGTVRVGDLIFYGTGTKTPLKKRRAAVLLEKNACAKMVKLKDMKTNKESWVKMSWTWRLVDERTANEASQLGLWGADPDFEQIESLVPYVGIH